jgi:NADPH:quinone reductase-like Zn-dependent oxidoreductase
MPKTYQVVQFHAYGKAEVMKVESLPVPTPGAGEVLVKVHYAGVNPIDWKLRSGAYHAYMPVTFPGTPGRDFSGVIEEVGPGAGSWKKGQAVLGVANGTYGEYVVAKTVDIVAKPEGLSFELAASLPVGALTGWQLVEEAGVQAGQRVLIQGAAGGVGLFALQFAKLRGAHVFGSSSTANLEFVKGLGAQEALDYSQGPLKIHDLDVVIDTVGGAVLESSFELLKKGGTLVTPAGQPSAEKAKTHGVTAKSVQRGPVSVLSLIADLVADKKVASEIQRIFPLAQVVASHELSEGGHGRGRILLKA